MPVRGADGADTNSRKRTPVSSHNVTYHDLLVSTIMEHFGDVFDVPMLALPLLFRVGQLNPLGITVLQSRSEHPALLKFLSVATSP